MTCDKATPYAPTVVTSPIFIGGQHRSGTTLMRRLLARHPHIACGPESNLFRDNKLARIHSYLRTEWASGLDSRYDFDPTAVDRALAALVNDIFTPYCRARDKWRWAEKTPKNILFIETLFALFPSAQFIHMIRDPRDVHCSVRAKAAGTTPRWADITPERTATEWRRRIDRGIPWRERPERYLEVRYEELVARPDGVMHEVMAFLGEPWYQGVLEGEHIFNTSVERWRTDLDAAEICAIEAVAGDTISALGYSLAADAVGSF